MYQTFNRLAVLGAVLAASAATYGAPPADGTKFEDWTVRCEAVPKPSSKLDVTVDGADKPANAAAANSDGSSGAEAAVPASGETETICQITQILNEKGSNKPVMQIAIGYLPEQKLPVAAVTLPLGIWLPPGLQLQVDSGKTGRVPVDTCIPGGCRAGVELDEQFLASMKKGSELNITFGGGTRQPVTVPVSLKGFTAALDSLTQ
jgi:invasion protein IalB